MIHAHTLRTYRHLFGPFGFLVAVRSKFLKEAEKRTVHVPWLKHPLLIRLHSTDVAAFRQIFEYREYNFCLSRDPTTILDAGANIGLTSIFFADKYPSAKIIAVEPEAGNFEILRENVSFYPNITPVHAAIWSENAQVCIVDPGLGEWGYQTSATGDIDGIAGCGLVSAFTVDEIMKFAGIEQFDILKMDIEGAEKEVFESVGPWIDKVGLLIVELHDGEKSGCSRSFYNATNRFTFEWKNRESVYVVNPAIIGARPY